MYALSCSHTKLQLLQAVSCSQPQFSPLGLISEVCASAPSSHLNQQMCFSGWRVWDRGTDHLCRSLFILAATKQLLCSPLRLWSSHSVVADLLLVRGCPRVQEPFLFYSSFPGAQLPSRLFSYFLLLLFSYQVTWRLSCLFKSLRSSSSLQQTYFVNHSMCKCIFDVFVGGSELYVLILHLDHQQIYFQSFMKSDVT